ncbi:Asp-tRNAAsn/Glu-tRNAGln amidotransferase A subunit family amidase [Streptomyces sp. TLI_235]|nr:Asp-tRNAAsn/Glu-tRNAGln amidotransferase A subunit family amidase [Streptomyces sp. TLI_235]
MEPMTPLVPAAARLRAGDPPLTEHVERLCTRIDRIDPALRAFVPEPGRHDRLAAAAKELEARYPDPAARPPLYGVAVGVKDVVHVDGLPTHAGSALPPGVLAGPEASLVGRLKAAGALIAGKTVTAEFAVLAPGPTRNPHDLGHTPGGSSSGSAAAVAAGLVPLAIGTQTVGSMIRPAAYCGVVGFRPTYGRMPVDGVIPHAPTLDTMGCYAADLAGVRLAAPLLCDSWAEPGGAPPAEPVLGVPVGGYLDEVAPEALAAFERTVRGLGLPVRRVDVLGDFDAVKHHLRTVIRYELAQVHRDLFTRFGSLYRPETVAAIRHGREIDRADHRAALAARDDFRRRVAAVTAEQGVDLWVTPAATGPAPLGLDSTGSAVMSLPWSQAGLPAVSLPAGVLGGLPLGLQCVGAEGGDERLLAAAAVIEARLAA